MNARTTAGVVALSALLAAGCSLPDSSSSSSSSSSHSRAGVAVPAETTAEGVGPGTYEVGPEIKPGKYKSRSEGGVMDICYWARLSGPNDTDIIDNHAGSGPTTVIIKTTDAYFTTSGCAAWVRAR